MKKVNTTTEVQNTFLGTPIERSMDDVGNAITYGIGTGVIKIHPFINFSHVEYDASKAFD